MRFLIDTVTFIQALQCPERISARALSAIQDDEAVREFSALSITEIAIRNGKGKLNLRREAIVAGLADLRMQVLPWNARHAFRLFDLPQHHADPFDRQIFAQALAENNSIVTRDEKFRLYEGVSR